MDIGTGDGSYAYKAARQNPEKYFIGLDSNAENMQLYSQKACKPLQKGGCSNLLFTIANADMLPEELNGLVSDITVLFPWGSLLKAVATTDEQFLAGLKRISAPGARFKALFSLEPTIEKKVMESFGLPSLSSESLDLLKAAYVRAGFKIKWRMISQDELKSFPSAWAKRLAYGRPRPCVELSGKLAQAATTIG